MSDEHTSFRASTFPQPRPAPRSLSSNIRQYRRSDLQSQSVKRRSTTSNRNSLASYGSSGHPAPLTEEQENQPLLSQSGQHSYSQTPSSEENEVEAQHSDTADSDGLYPPNCTWTSDVAHAEDLNGTRRGLLGGIPAKADPFGNAKCGVWGRIHEVRREIINSIDDPYSLEQLKAPRMNVTIVRPLVDKFYNMQDLCIVYCLLANRSQFIREQSYAVHHQTVNLTRALLCELLAEKVLRRYNEHNPGPLGLLKISNVLVAGFEPFQGAPESVIENSAHAMHWAHQPKAGSYERKMTALEVAIVSESKSFLASAACQRVVNAIYRGKIVYSPNSFIDIIPDHWKRRPISLYDPRRAPLLNQYRLIVPRTRNLIEVVQFIILIVLYIIVMAGREKRGNPTYEPIEAVFDIYAAGWVLDQLATILEHGWQVYTQNLWSFLDVMFCILFIAYFTLRMYALGLTGEDEATFWATTALDILSCAAPVLVPRLAFNVMSENMLFLSLRAMMGDFLTLTALAIWCFAGFLLSLKWLHNGQHHSVTIAEWMIWIWFGLDGTGIAKAPDFHEFLGPVLMITFAFLGNTLFLTILVSMLSNTFSMITANAVQEIQYRKTVLTFIGVKSDAIFAYMPPFNLLALVILLPLKFIVSPRTFHTINVAAVRTLNLPVLMIISWYERQVLWIPDRSKYYQPHKIDWKNPQGPRAITGWWTRAFQFWDFSRFSVHGDIQAVFDIEPPEDFFRQNIDTDDEPHQPDLGIDGGLRARSKTDHGDGTTEDRGSSVKAHDNKSHASSPQRNKHKRQFNREARIRREFFDSEDGHESNDDHPAGHKKTGKTNRKDSLIDYGEDHIGSHEANARLHKLEESVDRIERLLMQLISDAGDGADDDEGTQEQLRHDALVEDF